jgi:hypothetical protein
MRAFYALADKLFCRSITDDELRRDIDEAAAYRGIPAIQEMDVEFIALDTKAAALISHLSLMIAAISILHASVSVIWLKSLYLLEIVFYVCTLAIVIRVIYYSYYSEIIRKYVSPTSEKRTVELMREAKKRMIYYRWAHNWTNLGTLVLVITVILTLFARAY